MSKTPTINEAIEKLRADFNEKQKAAQIEFEKEMTGILETVKVGVRDSLEKAHKSFALLEKSEQTAVLDDAEIKKFFALFGYVKRKEKSGGTRGGRYDEAAILAFLSDGDKKQSVVQKHMNTTKQSIGDWGKQLESEKKVEIKKQGRVNIWHKV